MHIRLASPLLLVVVLAVVVPFTITAEPGPDDRQAFDRLKTLVGTWDATDRDNPAFKETVTYALTGRGTTLLERFEASSTAEGHMLTAYHMDVGRLVLTHFCGAGNQPRMRLRAASDRQVAFEMYDITNLADPKAYHSTGVEVTFAGEDRVEVTYRGVQAGREVAQVFQLSRRTR